MWRQRRMESFFALLQKNVLDRHRWVIRQELRLAVVSWIKTTYNGRRRQRGLGKLTPITYEMITEVALAALNNPSQLKLQQSLLVRCSA